MILGIFSSIFTVLLLRMTLKRFLTAKLSTFLGSPLCELKDIRNQVKASPQIRGFILRNLWVLLLYDASGWTAIILTIILLFIIGRG